MSQNNSNQTGKAEMLSKIADINKVDGFDPSPFVMDFTDLATGEVRKRLPVMTQIAWFRMRYPEGKFAVQVTTGKDCFVATARIYPSYKDPVDAYLSEASVSRGKCPDKPSVSPREWAQTAALGVALRNAGFGLQYEMAGDEFPSYAPNEFGEISHTEFTLSEPDESTKLAEVTPVPAPKKELTEEEKIELAKNLPCPNGKYIGKTLGDLICLDPKYLVWLVNKYVGDQTIKDAAKLLCEYSRGQQSA